MSLPISVLVVVIKNCIGSLGMVLFRLIDDKTIDSLSIKRLQNNLRGKIKFFVKPRF